jgi:membrane-associated phospholipid phosphatase
MKRATMKRTMNKKPHISILHRFCTPILLIVIFGFSHFGAADLFAQDIVLRDTVLGNKYNLSQFGHESVDFLIQPTKWDGGDWLRLGVISGATFLTMQVDQPIRNAVLKDRSYFYSVPIEGARMYGELYSPFVFFGGFALHYLFTDNISSRKIAYEIGQASLYTGAVVLAMKSIIGRARPHDNLGRATYHTFTLTGDDFHSLPGGHTATAFVISTVLSRNVHPPWLKIVVYVPAVITAFSRIYQDMHWTSDCVLGGALGYFIAEWVVDLHENNDTRLHVSSFFPLTISITLN